jgi:exonuclease III
MYAVNILSMAVKQDLKITTYNCKNVRSSTDEIRELCQFSDIILLQETWLAEHELPFVTKISDSFYAQGISSMDSNNDVLKGRPFGGLAVLWRKSLGSICKVIDCDDNRILGLEINNGGQKLLILNVYLPFDSGDNLDTFLFYLCKIESMISSYDTPYVLAFGDFNANISNSNGVRPSRFGRELLNFCHSEGLVITDKTLSTSNDMYTFYSSAHGTVSWLDHIISTTSAHSLVSKVDVHHKFVSSDHFPVSASVSLNNVNLEHVHDVAERSAYKIKWGDLSQDEISNYRNCTEGCLKRVPIDHGLLLCNDANCKDPSHISAINRLYCNITDALKEASTNLEKKVKHSTHQVAGWNDYCREAHNEAREAFLIWCASGKPRVGALYDLMRQTRARFKLVLRKCHVNHKHSIADSVARKFLHKDNKDFWKEIKKVNSAEAPPLVSTSMA